ncbi:5-oxoprolinase/urea amidolyase family protein [Kushneria marisflavi]|uniref:Allophanate hydrolase n=1 Tax=Kushneria marisflavi TaxID=157779 RepID=A0A240UNG3_9GAMM|nr:5-oxoprolinase/urea amidolyase family protein [Kushneria marisflavi]ART63047.1 allophanate hydrolase [Kushneria marisflavi]RKD84708.1 KipI family sensor histidine kinase inhibitor [Kushneria marisflavi]
MNILPVNLSTLLLELEDLSQTLGLYDQLQREPIHGVTTIIPAARTLLVSFMPGRISAEALSRELRTRPVSGGSHQNGELIEIPVYYNGEDLDDVARHLSLSTDEVIRRHGEHDYQVAFCGFAPGFAYLAGGAGFDVPRRDTPRTRIPAGSVALAGTFSGIYPTDSPGGWQLIGTTPLEMWDLHREPAALLQPGMRVRFSATAEAPERTSVSVPTDIKSASGTGATPDLEVLKPGLQSLFQDLGREGQTGQGVSGAGALDKHALRSANRAVGNPAGATVIETAHGGLSLRCHRPTIVAVTGAETTLTVSTAEGRRHHATLWKPIELAEGDTLTLGATTAGVRCYLAMRGGFDVTPILGSTATDTLAKLGPAPLQPGDALSSAALAVTALSLDETPAHPLPRVGECVTLDIVMGPRSDWFTEQALALLGDQVWQVTPRSDRVGIRLEGEHSLTRQRSGELPSEGTVTGALQVPASGQPVLFLADHPLTGGYPVIACVADHHLDLAGQIPPGATVRFHPITRFAPLAGDNASHEVTS